MAKIEKILFVDDDPICAFLNATLLEELGIAEEVGSLGSAEEALTFIQEHYSGASALYKAHPDIIFLDIKMPGMDGFEFLEALENMNGIDKSRFLIVMLTASLNPDDAARAARYGDKLYACLTKPLAEEDINQLLTAMLQTG